MRAQNGELRIRSPQAMNVSGGDVQGAKAMRAMPEWREIGSEPAVGIPQSRSRRPSPACGGGCPKGGWGEHLALNSSPVQRVSASGPLTRRSAPPSPVNGRGSPTERPLPIPPTPPLPPPPAQSPASLPPRSRSKLPRRRTTPGTAWHLETSVRFRRPTRTARKTRPQSTPPQSSARAAIRRVS